MRRFLFTLLVLISIAVSAQTCRTSEFSSRYVDEHHNWTEWTAWEKSSLDVIFHGTEFIEIRSPKLQYYTVTCVLYSREMDESGINETALKAYDDVMRPLTIYVYDRKTGTVNIMLRIAYDTSEWRYLIPKSTFSDGNSIKM